MTQTGRPSIFSPKDGGKPIRVLALTAKGQKRFEQARAELKKLANWPGAVSDGDVIDYLVRDRKLK